MGDQGSYNPNAIWTSKKKKFDYKPKERVSYVEKKSDAKNSPNNNSHGSGWSALKVALLVVLILATLGVLGFAAYITFKPAPPLVAQLSFVQAPPAFIGDPFSLSLVYKNASAQTLSGATLSLTLPAGVSFLGQSPDQRVMQWSIGDMLPNATGTQSSTLIVTGNPQSVEHLSALLTYNSGVSQNIQFQTSATTDIIITTPAAGVTITVPSNVVSGQNFVIAVAYVNNTTHALGDVKINMQYPPAFTFVGSSVSPDSSVHNEWDVGSLPPNASGNFSITGNIFGQDGSPYAITGSASETLGNAQYAIASQTASLVIAASPLKFTMTINGGGNYVAGLGDSLTYDISYVNTSNVTLQNAVISAKFTGAMFDFGTLQSPGSFNSVTDVLTWTGANTPGLLTVAPGQSGTVEATIRTKNAFPIRLPSNKNYSLGVHAQIISPTVPAGVAASSTVAAADLTDKVGGLITFISDGFRNDPRSKIINTGPYPPKVNQPTQYTIHWRITNYSTDIANVTVSAYLQSGTTCTGKFESTVSGDLPTCDPSTGLVSWTIPQIAATTGVISPPAEAVFQVINTPAVNEVGRNVTLLGPTTFAATDQFTNAAVNQTAPAIDTSLPDDTTKTLGARQVGQ